MNLYTCSKCGAEAIVRDTKPQINVLCCDGVTPVKHTRGRDPAKKVVVKAPEVVEVAPVSDGIAQGLQPQQVLQHTVVDLTTKQFQDTINEQALTIDELTARCGSLQSQLDAANAALLTNKGQAPKPAGTQLDVSGAVHTSTAPTSDKF